MSTGTWPDGAVAAISLSFDDGRASQVDTAIPILDALGVRGTFYAIPKIAKARLEGWKTAAMDGHEIGNHTLHHPCSGNFPFGRERALEHYTLDMIESECREADAWIAEHLGVTPETFAYPCGQSYVGAGTGTHSYVPVIAKRYTAARCFAEGAINDPEHRNFHQLAAFDIDTKPLTALLSIVEAAVASGGWAILAGHDVGDGSARQTTGAAALETLITRILNWPQRVWIDTVSAVATYLKEREA